MHVRLLEVQTTTARYSGGVASEKVESDTAASNQNGIAEGNSWTENSRS